ncbi:MAG: hypothetical protein QM718_05410 [Steroidobacteraceae bacterium]
MKITTAALIASMGLGLGSAVARAETIVVNDQVTVRPSSVATPTRGITMASVEKKFGAPAEKHAAVGKPPITRWDYPTFSVFFEYERVIHAVAIAP